MEQTMTEEIAIEEKTEEAIPTADKSDSADDGVSEADRFYNAVREMKNHQHATEKELVALMAKKLGISERDYDSIRARLTEEEEKEDTPDDFSEKLKSWQEREGEVQKLYPGFVLATELKNRDFFNLCYNGVDIMTAYQVLHLDDIITSAMSYAVSELKRAGMLNGSASGRVREAALDSGTAKTRQEKPKLTKKERNELIRRAERGETVRL